MTGVMAEIKASAAQFSRGRLRIVQTSRA